MKDILNLVPNCKNQREDIIRNIKLKISGGGGAENCSYMELEQLRSE